MTQCSVLIISGQRCEVVDRKALRSAGFLVDESADWPADSSVAQYHIVLVEFSPVARACMLAARLRAKRGIGQRVLMACVPESTPKERRDALEAGFDGVIDRACTPRQQVAAMLSCLRARPEFRCLLPRRGGRAA
ncbi:MAG TPA: hypothetical protein VF147_07685 [Vicinamibacterales bacterium]